MDINKKLPRQNRKVPARKLFEYSIMGAVFNLQKKDQLSSNRRFRGVYSPPCGVGQVVDQSKGFRQFDESFGQAFSKACGFSRQSLESPSAEGEIPLTASLFAKLFLCAYLVREKADVTNLCIFYFYCLLSTVCPALRGVD